MALLGIRAGAPRRPGAWADWLGWLALVFLLTSAAHGQVNREYGIKAVFLFNFAQFVEWPPTAFGSELSPLVIGVLGEDPFGPLLEEAVAGETVAARPLAVRRFRQVEEIDVCHVLFIGRSEAPRLEAVLARLRGRPILTVGDSDGFAQRGGMIRFVMESNKVRMRINPETARQAGLTLSSKLLRPATIIGPGRD